MKHMICLAGFPRLVVEEISRASAQKFTGDRANAPIMKGLPEPLFYRPGMPDYYLQQLARRIGEEKPTQDIGVGIICADYGESTSAFLDAFFPFAIVATVDPIYLNVVAKHERRKALTTYVSSLAAAAEEIRSRIAVVRDVLSGNNFSPLLLPLRNFRSAQLSEGIRHLFDALGTTDNVRAALEGLENTLSRRHPRRNMQDANRTAYFEDDRSLRFKSPGKDKHAMARRQGEQHSSSCFIGARTRLGGPIGHAFHYDCDYERGGLDRIYTNCHGADVALPRVTHANIAPNDYVR
jgi:hypothetical protein